MVKYPEDWKSYTLGELGDVRMCKRIFASQTTKNGEIPFYKIGTFGGKADAFIPRALYEDYKNRFSFPKAGDTLLSAAGTIGRTVVYDGKDAYFQDSNIVWLEVSEEDIYKPFLKYFFESYPWVNLEGTTISRLYNGLIRSTPIALPDISEQRSIAEALTSMDTHISNLTELIEKKKAIRDGALEDLVSGRTRLEGFNGKWHCNPLAKLGTFVKGAPLSKAAITSSGTPLILYGELYTTYGDVVHNVIHRTNVCVEQKYFSVTGDVIIPTSGETAEEIATAACVMQDGVILGGDLMIIKTNKLLIDGRFLSYTINHVVNRAIADIAQGISVIHIKPKEVSRIAVLYPDIDEQRAIADVIEAMDDEIASLEIERDKMQQIKAGMMDDLLTGRVRLIG